MSEAERQRRINYKANRKKVIVILSVILVIVAISAIACGIVYSAVNKTVEAKYTESGSVDYRVGLKPNDYYEEEWLPSGGAYVAELIDKIEADLSYKMDVEVPNVYYEFVYDVIATLEIRDNKSNKVIQSTTKTLVPQMKGTQSSNSALEINEKVLIDYDEYNLWACGMVDALNLDATSTIILSMNVEVISTSENLESESANTYTTSLNIPVDVNTVDVFMTSSAPSGGEKILKLRPAYNPDAFKGACIGLASFDLLILVVLIAFIILTKNHDINYANKVRRIRSSYKSFIQRILNGFDTEGYQVLLVASFNEMLSIRDTIQSPILMSENTDQTRTQFFIPTNTKILYLFEIKVDNYDELYGNGSAWVDDSVVKLEKTGISLGPVDIAKPIPEAPTKEKTVAANAAEPKAEEEISPEACPEIKKEQKTVVAPAEPAPEKAPEKAPEASKEPATVAESAQPVYREINIPSVIEHKVSFVDSPFVQSNNDTAELVVSKLIDRLGEVNLAAAKAEVEATEEPAPKVEAEVEPVEEPAPEVEAEVEPVEEPAPEVEAEVEVAEESAPEVEAEVEVAEEPAPKVEAEVEAAEEPAPEVEAEVEPVEEPATENNLASMVINPDDIIEISASDATSEGDGDDEDDEESFVYYDKQGNKIDIRCRRSCLANIIQSDNDTIKKYYSQLKNYILSFKTVKARMSWRYETFKKGRYQLFRLKIRGKTICLYCALNPAEFDTAKYFHEATDAKMFEQVPMLVRIRSDRGIKKAFELIDVTMEKFGLKPDPKAEAVDYVAEHPYERTQALIDRELIKILIPEGYVAIDPTHIVKAESIEMAHAIEEALAEPDVKLEEIDFVDEIDEAYEETKEHPGVEVIGVVWKEKDHGNRIYRYDPNGQKVEDGDMVLVPTKSSSTEIIRKAAVAHGNHKVDPESIKHPLKKIISVIKRKMEDVLSGK